MNGNPSHNSIPLFIEHYRLIFAASQDGVLLVDPSSWIVLETNSTAKALLSHFTQSLIGANLRDFSWFGRLPIPSNDQGLPLAVEGFSLHGIDISPEEGPTLKVDLVVNPLTINETILLQVILRDVTKQNKVEEKLNIYIKGLEWSNRELQEFAHIASHDLQEPLRAIQAFADRLHSNYSDQLGHEGQEYLERVNESATRMRTLINDLLSYSRVTSKARTLTSVPLNMILEAVCDDLETPIRESGASIEVGELPIVHANPTLMRQLFQNLIANSIKYRKLDIPLIIRVFAFSGNPHAESESSQQTSDIDSVAVIVNDNGIGFDQKYAERIFGPFQRLHSQRRFPGTGIGLAICRKIVELCFGSISATSESNVGTSINIKLPTRARLTVSDET